MGWAPKSASPAATSPVEESSTESGERILVEKEKVELKSDVKEALSPPTSNSRRWKNHSVFTPTVPGPNTVAAVHRSGLPTAPSARYVIDISTA